MIRTDVFVKIDLVLKYQVFYKGDLMSEQKLEIELERIKNAINSNAFPYLFLVSNKENIRNYFMTNISDLNEINVVNDISISHEELMNKLENKKGILYVNNETKKNNEDNSLYYALVAKREVLWHNKKTIVIVCDEKTSISLLSANASLSTVSWFCFLDEILKDKENFKKLIK